nr:MAG TPA: hypothetical protein [Caudoviricetes sp.]
MKNSPLERKIFTVELLLPGSWRRGDFLEMINIPQATVLQTMQYLRKKAEGIPEGNLILLSMEEFRKKKFTKRQKQHLLSNEQALIQIRNQTFLFGIQQEKFLPTSNEAGAGRSPDGSFFCFLSKELCTPVPMILNEMTWEQVRELVVGLSWNANALTEEGKMRNQNYQYQEKFEKENDMDALREALKD